MPLRRIEHPNGRWTQVQHHQPTFKPTPIEETNVPSEPTSSRADRYKGSRRLLAKKVLLTGGDSGIGRAVAMMNDPIAMLSADHRHVEQLFASFEKATKPAEKENIAREICTELVVHSMIEEELFYPACQGRMDKKLLDEAQVEHDGAKMLIREIQHGSPDDEFYDAKVKLLSEQIKHHVQEEEQPGQGVFAHAKNANIATPDLAQRLAARKQELMEQAKADALGPPETRSFRTPMYAEGSQRGKGSQMARGSGGTMERERDERGRFMSDDDDDRDYRRSSRSRYDDDDDDRRGRRGHGGWFGDSEGHSRAARMRDDEDDRRSGGRYRSRDDDDDGRGHGRGGWFGDPDGHSEASRRGWQRSDHEGSGWYGDSRGHSEASRRGWERSDHEGSGWYGDPRGHSEASREGWEDRGRGGTRSRSRYDDDDDYRRGGRGDARGWYGDPEGHSRASREGWDDRGRGGSRNGRRDDDNDDGRGHGRGGWFGDPEGHSQAARQRRR